MCAGKKKRRDQKRRKKQRDKQIKTRRGSTWGKEDAEKDSFVWPS